MRTATFEQWQLTEVDWSPNGRTIACAAKRPVETGSKSEARAWILNADTLEIRATLHMHQPEALTFTPDSSALLVAGRTAGLRWFDAWTGAPLANLQAHEGLVNGLDFSPDGIRLATVGGDEGDIIVWDTTAGPPYKPVARFHERGFVGSVKWDSNGRRLIGACDKTIRIWDDKPLRERTQARSLRRQVIARVDPLVANLLDELKDAAKVIERLNADPTLTPLERRTAQQCLLRMRLATFEADTSSRLNTGAPSIDPVPSRQASDRARDPGQITTQRLPLIDPPHDDVINSSGPGH